MPSKLLTAGWLCGLFALALADPRLHLELYRGHFRHDPEFLALIERIEPVLSAAPARISESLGVALGADFDVAIGFVELDDGKSGQTGNTSTERLGSKPIQRIVFNVQYFLSGEAELEVVLVHELVHAAMRHILGDAHAPLPRWVREGMALYIADEGEGQILRHLSTSNTPDELIYGLLEKDRSLKGYPYAYMAIREIARSKPGAFKSFAAAILAGRGPEEAVRESLGLDFPAFEARVEAAVRRELDGHRPAHQAYEAALASAKETPTNAAAIFKDFVALFPDTPYTENGRYYWAKAHYEAKQYREGLEIFEAIVAHGAGKTGLRDEALLYAGLCAYGLRDYERSAQHLSRLVNVFPFASQWARGCFFWAKAEAALGNRFAERELYQRLLKGAPAGDGYRSKAEEGLKKLGS